MLVCAMTLIQDLRSKVKVITDLFRSSSGPFILFYLPNLAKTTFRQWVHSTETFTQVSMWKVRCHIRLLCKILVHAVFFFSLFYLPYSTPLHVQCLHDVWYVQKKNQVRGQGQAKSSYSNFEALGNSKK